MLHARANGSLLNFIPLLRQTGTITLPSSGTARGCQGSIGSLGFFHLLLSLVVTARSTPPSTLAMSPRWRGPSSWSPISPCSVVPLLGCVRPWVFSPIHLLRCKVSPRGTLSYIPPAPEGVACSPLHLRWMHLWQLSTDKQKDTKTPTNHHLNRYISRANRVGIPAGSLPSYGSTPSGLCDSRCKPRFWVSWVSCRGLCSWVR